MTRPPPPVIARATIGTECQVYLITPGQRLSAAGLAALRRLAKQFATASAYSRSHAIHPCGAWLFCHSSDAEHVERSLREVAKEHTEPAYPPGRFAAPTGIESKEDSFTLPSVVGVEG